mgnify:CR=1 FL=1
MIHRTCARIHLDHLRHNFREIQKAIAPAGLIPVVKADAYGHGAVAVSRCLVDQGARMLAVAQFQEAMALRDSGIAIPILIFGRVFPDALPESYRIQYGGRWLHDRENPSLPEALKARIRSQVEETVNALKARHDL